MNKVAAIDQDTLEKLCPWVHREAVLTRERNAALARVAELEAARVAYASEFDGDVGNIHASIRALKAKEVELKSADIAATYAIRALSNAVQEIEQLKDARASPSVWQSLTESWRTVATQAMSDRDDAMARVLELEADKHNLKCNLAKADERNRPDVSVCKHGHHFATMAHYPAINQKEWYCPHCLLKENARLETELDTFRETERKLSDAYLRLRNIIPGGCDPVSGPAEVMWTAVEGKLRAVLRDAREQCDAARTDAAACRNEREAEYAARRRAQAGWKAALDEVGTLKARMAELEAAHTPVDAAGAVMLDMHLALVDDARHESECQRERADNHKRVAWAALQRTLKSWKLL